MSEPPGTGAGLPWVDVLVTVPAGSRLEEAGPGAAACFVRHRVEWRGAEVAADGQQTWHFRAPDTESVRLALRHAAIPCDTLRVARGLDSTLKS